jgi:hypothetical protein
VAEDDLLLDASDLADIFGADDAKAGDDLAKSIEDLFLSDDPDDEEAAEGAPVATAVAAPPRPPVVPPPAAPRAAPRSPEPVHSSPIDLGEEEPELVEPDRGGMTEEEWRGSAEYTEFKKQVIARHLRKKATEDLARRAAEERAKLQELEQAEQARQEAAVQAQEAEAAAAQAHQAEEAAAKADAERRRQEALDKYKAAKAATIAQRAQALVQAQDNAEAADSAAEAEKAAKLKGYLADLKNKVAAGGLPPMNLQAKVAAPQLSAAGKGMAMDVAACKALAAMFEETRTEMLKHVSDAIGKKPAQAMMKKTLAKVAKLHLDVFGRAAVDGKNELRVDGGLDEERLSRALYALPEGARQEKVQKAFFELTEMRFIACELGLGHRQKAVIVSRTLNALETSFARKGHPKPLVDWYFTEAVPSTSLADSDDPAY